MASNFDAAYIQQYSDNLQLASQQRESRLLKSVMIDRMAGVNKYFEKIGKAPAPLQQVARVSPLVLQDINFERRPVTPVSWREAIPIDKIDQIRMAIDPSGSIMQNIMFSFNRLIDSTIIAAVTGPAYTQATVNSSFSTVSLPSSQNIPVGYDEPGTGQTGNTGFTVGKLKAGRALLESQEAIVPGERVYVIWNSTQKQQLLRDPQVTNVFYNDVKPLISGEVADFLGVTFIHSELIANTQTAGQPYTGQSTALMYPESAIQFCWLDPLHGTINPRYDLGEVYQLYGGASFGATRMFEERVVTITTDNTQ